MHYQIYEELGLTQKEAEVYESLLHLGESPVADVVQDTNSHPQLVYRALDGLARKQLVTTSYYHHKKYVRAEDPSQLVEIAEAKVAQVKNSLPELLALQTTSKNSLVKVYHGGEGVRTVREQIINTLGEGDTYYNIGGSGDRFYEIMGDKLFAIEKKRIKKGIHRRLVTYQSQKEMTIKNNLRFMELCEFRFLPENYPTPSAIGIYGDTIATFVFSGIPLVITIKNKEVAESYLNYFKTLWESAKP